MNGAEIAAVKEKFVSDIQAIMRDLEASCPGIVNKDLMNYLNEEQKQQIIKSLENAEKDAENSSDGAFAGAATGTGVSYILLGVLGVHGFSAAGLTSGLAALGLGFGMIGGIFVVPAIIGGAMLWNQYSVKEKKLAKL